MSEHEGAGLGRIEGKIDRAAEISGRRRDASDEMAVEILQHLRELRSEVRDTKIELRETNKRMSVLEQYQAMQQGAQKLAAAVLGAVGTAIIVIFGPVIKAFFFPNK
jgi:hypothetical protein